MSVDRGEGVGNQRPCVRVSGRFAGEVPGVEFVEGGGDVVDVVGVEQDLRRDPLLGVDLNDVKHLGVEVPGPLIRPQPSGPTEE